MRRLRTVLLIVFASLATEFVVWLFRHRSAWLAAAAGLLPFLGLALHGFLRKSNLTLIASVAILCAAVAEGVYSRFVLPIVINDIGVASVVVAVTACLAGTGKRESDAVRSFHLAVFQTYITVLSVVFMLGVFLLQTHNLKHSVALRAALGGFAAFFTLGGIVSLGGYILTSEAVDLSGDYLESKQPVSRATFGTCLFIAAVCLISSSTTYLFVLFSMFLRP